MTFRKEFTVAEAPEVIQKAMDEWNTAHALTFSSSSVGFFSQSVVLAQKEAPAVSSSLNPLKRKRSLE